MINELFDINKFNIFSDDENYYFFRSLEEVDIESINNNAIIDDEGNIRRLITDREYYGETIFKEDAPLSLEQIIEHIKMDYNKHTNCISFSSNTNVILDYGRNIYNDRYVMLKVPKNEFGKKVVNAGEYILQEITNVLDEYYTNLDDKMTKYFFDAIDNAKNVQQLESIKLMLTKEYVDKSKNIFINGLERIINSQNHNALNSKQNLLKDKIILKMDLMKKPILDRIGNKFLINVMGCAFSSLEIIHYNNVEDYNITEISPEIIDLLSLLQQVPETSDIAEIKKILIKKINNKEINNNSFDLDKYNIEKHKENLTLFNIYKLTKGNIDYKTATNIYTKVYILAKSRLRKEKSLNLMKEIIDDKKYDYVIDYLRNNTYGIEPEITDRQSNKNSINISESVNLLINSKEKPILDYVNNLSIEQIYNLLNNPFEEMQNFIEDNYTDKYITENWFANSIIDLIDWKYYKIEEDLSLGQRELIINILKDNNFLDVYEELRKSNLSDKEIANIIILKIIRQDKNLSVEEKFSLSELEEFLGCNQIINTGIKLKSYQKKAYSNVNKIFNKKQYTSAIMPTGTGKSYLALAEMHYFEYELSKLEENRHAKILYLAPNSYILNQLKRIISKNYRNNFSDTDDKIIKKAFPNLQLCTYSYLAMGINSQEIIKNNYDLIILDELHRTGANEWGKQLTDLLDNQSNKTKILGITATPERDMDRRDMSEEFAKKYGYTEDEILENAHLACNMNLIDAIKAGIIHNPNVINCEYSLLKDGSLDELELKIEDIVDENLQKEKRKEYEILRREIANADGIEKILKDNLKSDGKYIVFIPLTKNADGNYINTESEEEITESQAQRMIKSYQDLMNQFLFSGEYLEIHKEKLSLIYDKLCKGENLSNMEIKYLNDERSNIQLLTRLHIDNCPNALQILTNDISIKIIEYMKWEILQDSKITSILNQKMKNDVESYNMISDNSKGQNDRNLSNFNSSKSNKKKFMFVMDMLNEGVHVDRIDGIIWFRALNENSKILFLQQLGRCISAIGEDNKDNIPTIIDLVNNTLKIDILKGIKKEQADLNKIMEIYKWSTENGYPNYDSMDKSSEEYYRYLKKIQHEYVSFLESDKLEKVKSERKVLIKKIIEIGSELDLWNFEFEKENSNKSKDNYDLKNDNLISLFGIKGRLRKFSNLYKEIEKDLNPFDVHINEMRKWFDLNNRMPIGGYKTTDRFLDGVRMYDFLCNARDKGKISEYENTDLYNIVLKYDPVFFDSSLHKVDYFRQVHILEAVEWFKREKRMPVIGEDKFTDGNDIRKFIDTSFNINYIKENCHELFNLIKEYNPTYGTNKFIIDYIFEKQLGEVIEWFKKYQRKPKGADARNGNKGDCFSDGKNIYDFLRQKKEKIKKCPELVELINKYYPTYFDNNNIIDYKFEQHLKELIQWFKKNNKKLTYPKNVDPEKKEKFSDGILMHDFLFRKNNVEKIVNNYKNELIIIKSIYPLYGISSKDIIQIKMKELYDKFYECPEKLTITSQETFEIDKTNCVNFLKNNRTKIFNEAKKGNEYAIWLVDKILSRKTKISPEKYVEVIELYCKTFNEWPKKSAINQEVEGLKGNQLYSWLIHTSGYNNGNFKYEDEYPVLKEKLDKLKSHYFKSKKYDEAKEKFDSSSHFQKVVKNIEHSKENTDGRKLH